MYYRNVPISEFVGLLWSTKLLPHLTFTGPCIVIYSYNKSQQDAIFLIFIW